MTKLSSELTTVSGTLKESSGMHMQLYYLHLTCAESKKNIYTTENGLTRQTYLLRLLCCFEDLLELLLPVVKAAEKGVCCEGI